MDAVRTTTGRAHMMRAMGYRKGWRSAVAAVAAVALGLVAGCIGRIGPDRLLGSQGTDATMRVAVLGSGPKDFLGVAVDALVTQLGDAQVGVYWVSDEISPRALRSAIGAFHPDIVVALGAFSAHLASDLLDYPIIYALALQDEANILTGRNIAGIAMQVRPLTEFTLYKMVLPQLRRVLTFSTASSTQLLAKASDDLAQLGIELVGVTAASEGDVQAQYQRHAPSVDAVWLLNDPNVVKASTFRLLREATLRDNKPFLCSSFEKFADEGALMVVSVDLRNIGAQAAAIADSVVEKRQSIAAVGVQDPIGGKLLVNQATAAAIGLTIPARARPFVRGFVGTGPPGAVGDNAAALSPNAPDAPR